MNAGRECPHRNDPEGQPADRGTRTLFPCSSHHEAH
jgi:hypothetical protein